MRTGRASRIEFLDKENEPCFSSTSRDDRSRGGRGGNAHFGQSQDVTVAVSVHHIVFHPPAHISIIEFTCHLHTGKS